jgi:hypothetical protein
MLKISSGLRVSTRRFLSVSPSASFDESVKTKVPSEKNIQIDPSISLPEHFFDESIKVKRVAEKNVTDTIQFKALMSDRYIRLNVYMNMYIYDSFIQMYMCIYIYIYICIYAYI